MELPKRKPNRLSFYNYSTPGAYFITICTDKRLPILGNVIENGIVDTPQIHLTKIGKIVQRYILSGNNITGITVDKFIIMPNHIHMILLIDETASNGTSRAPSPTAAAAPSCPANQAIPHFVSTLKRFCHRDTGRRIFQRSYHDHVIRDEADYLLIWQYIDSNPAKWQEDCFFIEQLPQGVDGDAPNNDLMEEKL